jgi:hypothetical protein
MRDHLTASTEQFCVIAMENTIRTRTAGISPNAPNKLRD